MSLISASSVNPIWKEGTRPSGLFAAEARDMPLYVTLRNRPGKGFTDIGSFWNARGRYTVLARDLGTKSGLRFGGNVRAWKSQDILDAERAAEVDVASHDAEAARVGADKRVRKARDKSAVLEG
jgi:hypothetical protein